MADIRYAIRALSKNPAFAFIALFSISLSVGAVAVVFAAVKAVILDPLPYARPDELVQVATDHTNAARSSGDWVFWNDALELMRRTRTLESIGIYGNAVFDLAGDSSTPPEALYGLRVSERLFPTLGVSPRLGRNILPEEDQPGHSNVIILSNGLWQRRFQSDRSIIGRTVKINGQECTVIGVMAPEFNFPLRRAATRSPFPYVEFWAPLQAGGTKAPQGGLGLVARLRPGVSLTEARADLAFISAALTREFPASNRDRTHRLAFLRDRTVRSAANALWLLMAASFMFLVIGCANVANLLLACGFSRQHEITVRMAIGASGNRIIRQLLTESCVLAVLGGVGGFVLTAAAWSILPALAPVTIPRLSAARADWPVFAFALSVAFLNGLLFGAVPAIRAVGVGSAGFTPRGTAGGKQDRLRGFLVLAEVAITVLLVVVGGHFLGNFLRLLRTDPGFEADRTFASVVLPARERYRTPGERARIYSRFLSAVRAIPGVESAGTVDALPFSGENHGGFISADPGAPFEPGNQILAEIDIAGGEYLQTMGVRLLEGRWFRDEEMTGSNDTAIVDETVARRLWPGISALEKRICVYCTPESPNNWKRVIGVVPAMRHSSLEGTVHHNVYLSGGALENAAFLVVRTTRPVSEMEKAVRVAIAGVDPDQPVLLSAPLRSLISDSIADRRFIMSLLAITGCLALLLSAAGVYGVAAYNTSRRTREIGIRVALGATPSNVHSLIFRQGFVVVTMGLALGFVSGFGVLRVIRAQLEGFGDGDSALGLIAGVLVMAAAGAACWIPARRATRIGPMSALREE